MLRIILECEWLRNQTAHPKGICKLMNWALGFGVLGLGRCILGGVFTDSLADRQGAVKACTH